MTKIFKNMKDVFNYTSRWLEEPRFFNGVEAEVMESGQDDYIEINREGAVALMRRHAGLSIIVSSPTRCRAGEVVIQEPRYRE